MTLGVVQDWRSGYSDADELDVYAYEIEESEDPFDDRSPAQEQIPGPDDELCRGVIAFFGEWIGRPLAEDFPKDILDVLQPDREDRDYRLVHPWRPAAAKSGGFPLTGSTFEVLAAIAVDRLAKEDRSVQRRPLVLRILGAEEVLDQPDPKKAPWGNRQLRRRIQEEFRNDEGEEYRRRAIVWEQLEQLRNFVLFINNVLGHVTYFVADEDEASEQLETWLKKNFGGFPRDSDRDPFKGLQFYDVDDSTVFYGRENDRKQAMRTIRSLWYSTGGVKWFWVRGVSGAGKSSFLRAGLIGRFARMSHARETYAHCVLRPNDVAGHDGPGVRRQRHGPLRRLFEICFQRVCELAAEHADAEASVATRLADFDVIADEEKAAWAARVVCECLNGTGESEPGRRGERRLIVGFDQFEEAVDMLGDTEAGPIWESLFDFLIRLSRLPGILVLATIREDRIEALREESQLASLYRESAQAYSFLDLPGPSELMEVIRTPFEDISDLALGDDLVMTLTDRIRDFASSSGRGIKPASLLPLISLTLERLHKEVALPLIEEQRNLPVPDGRESGSAAAQADLAGVAQSEFEHAADADSRAGQAVVLTVEKAGDYLDIGSAVKALAEEAVEEARKARGLNWEDTAIGALLRRLIAWTGSEEQQFTLPAREWPTDDDLVALAQAMKQSRLIVQEEGDRIRLVHEAVVSNWPAAQDWLNDERPLLQEMSQLRNYAEKWCDDKLSEKALEAASHFNVQPAARLLVLWFDILVGLPRDPDLKGEALLRDFCLALISHCNTPQEIVTETPRRPPHFHLPVLYNRIDIVRDMLAQDPEVVDAPRSDKRTALFSPAFDGNLEMIELLLGKGAAPDVADEEHWRPIHAASVNGSVEVSSRLVEAGADLGAAEAPGGTAPIHLAAGNNRIALLDYFVKTQKVDVDLRDAGGWTPIVRAAQANQVDAIRTLVKLGGDPAMTLQPDSDADFGWTALHLAARDGAADAIGALVEVGLNVNTPMVNGATPLHLAAGNGKADCVGQLIENGASLDAGALDKWSVSAASIKSSLEARSTRAPRLANAEFDVTPLHKAVIHDRADIACLLLEHKANVDAATGSGATSLHLAAAKNSRQLLECLLAYRPDTELRDAAGQTAFQTALKKGAFNAARALQEAGAATDAVVCLSGRLETFDEEAAITPLHEAAGDGNEDVVRFLLRQGVDLDAADRRGWTPLHYAAAAGNAEIAECLLTAGAARAVADETGMTALHLACRSGFAALVELLFATDGQEQVAAGPAASPLHLAAHATSAACVDVLLQAGHPVDPRDRDGWTPLHCAIQMGAEECVGALLEAGADPHSVANPPGIGALQLAAQTGAVDCIRSLLRQTDLSPNEVSGEAPSPLLLAIRYRQFDAAVALIDAGASVESRDPETGFDPVEAYRQSVQHGHELGVTDARHARLELAFEAAGLSPELSDLVPPRPGVLERPPRKNRRLLNERRTGQPLQPGATAFYPDFTYAEPNPWSAVVKEERDGFLQRISPADGKFVLDTEDTEVWFRKLPWYEEAALIHVKSENLASRNIRLCYLTDHGNLFRLNGTSPPIHEVNAKAPLKLNESNVLDYLRFFCFFVRGDEGPFYVAESMDDPFLPGNLDPTTKSVIEGTIRAATFEGVDQHNQYLCDAVLFYSNAIFIANFAVQSTGMVEMIDDEPIAADLPCKVVARLS